MEVLKKEVRALLTAAKGGLTPAELEEQYMAMTCKPLPLRELGVQSTLELVALMPDVVKVCSSRNGTLILKAIADDTTKGIAQLIARQKTRTCIRARKRTAAKANAASPYNDSWNPERSPLSARTPVQSAAVKAEQQDLLSSSPLLLMDSDEAQEAQEEEMSQSGVPQGEAQEEEVPQGEAQEEEDVPQGEAQEEEVPQGEAQEEEDVPQGEAQEEEVQQATSAAEMPPLEPRCEKESFYQAAVEMKSEPLETQAVDLGDCLKQPQDVLQSLLGKLTLAPEIPPDAVWDRSLCSLPPLKAGFMVGVSVECVVSPSLFYVHISTRESSHELQDLMLEMKHVYSRKVVSDRYIMPEAAVRPGQLCCAVVSRWWYRVVVHRVVSDREVEVFYADYGHLQIVRKSWLRFLKCCYLKLPAQAVPCSLARVKPVGGTWSSAATLRFKNLCHFKLVVGIVDEYANGILYFFLCDTSTGQDVYFHSVLRDEGYAHICRRNIPYQEFKGLNLSALYVQPNEKQENAELVEPDLGLQQESLDAHSETATSKLDGAEPCDQAPHSLGESSVPEVLVKSVEDSCTSFIHSEQPAEMRQDDPDQTERFSSKAQQDEEKLRSKELPKCLGTGLCSASGLCDQVPPQKLYFSPTTLSAVLAAAQLATPHEYFQWLPSLRKKV